MTELIWQNFGFLELILATEFVILLTAAFFYQVAKIIAKTDRHDPLVRFYRVFWRSFMGPVTSIRELDLRQAEYAARMAGVTGVGDGPDLVDLDAADLVDLDSAEVRAGQADAGPPVSRVQPIGRTGGENDPRLRTEPQAGPSRELQFAARAKAAREQQPADDDMIPISRERDVTASPPPPKSVPVGQSAATSTFDACINPFQPRPRLAGIRDGEVIVDVTCSPEDGQANAAIITLVAERIGVRPYQIVLLRGHYKVRKTLQVAGLDQQTLNARLSAM
jgi:uncharacterized protein YggU (UPF0235/DUF167 family)